MFAPCALGAVINDNTLPRLKVASSVAGSPIISLPKTVMGRQLTDRGILYAPDYVINAGGVINISHEFGHRAPATTVPPPSPMWTVSMIR